MFHVELPVEFSAVMVPLVMSLDLNVALEQVMSHLYGDHTDGEL